jgi:hypothetical protein
MENFIQKLNTKGIKKKLQENMSFDLISLDVLERNCNLS